jgi:hypothetical protein
VLKRLRDVTLTTRMCGKNASPSVGLSACMWSMMATGQMEVVSGR